MSLKKLILCGLAVALSAATATAGPIRDRLAARFGGGGCQPCQTQPVYTPTQSAGVPFTDGNNGNASSSVQWKADAQARRGTCYHPGGGFVPGATYEGVGFSSVSPEHALSVCCNNGGPVVAQAVAAGPGGWYAVKQYGSPGAVGVAGVVRQAVGGTVQGVGQVVQYAGGVLVHGTSYQPPVVSGGGVAYQPIRLGAGGLLPTTCSGGNCGR